MNFKYDGFTLSELTDLTDVVLMRDGSSPDHHLYFEIQALENAGRYFKKSFRMVSEHLLLKNQLILGT